MVLNIVIAGAGIVGNSIAYYLTGDYAPAAASVTLVDPAGSCPAASAKAGGFLARDWRDRSPMEALQRLGFALHEELARELDGSGVDEDGRVVNRQTDYRRLRCKGAAVDGGILNGTHAAGKFRGARTLEWVDEDVLLATGTLGTEDDIAQVHPRKLCQAMWEASAARGVQLRVGRVARATTARRPPSTAPRIAAVQLEDGTTIAADVLLAAMGPWSEELRRWFPPHDDVLLEALALVPPITGVKSHSMLVRTPGVLREAVFFESRDDPTLNDLEVYPRPDGDAYVTGSSQPRETMAERPGEEAVERRREAELRDSARRTAPAILGARAPHTVQACYWADAADGVPVVGPVPYVDGLYVATG